MVLAFAASAAACSGTGSSGSSSRDSSWTASGGDENPVPTWGSEDAMPAGPGGTAAAKQPARPKGPSIRVTWEALAYERQLQENPRHGFRQEVRRA